MVVGALREALGGRDRGHRDPASVGAELRALVDAELLDLPLPGAGRTRQRWDALEALGEADLALTKLAEGHTDAVAVLAEAGRTPPPGALLGVWASGVGTGGLVADALDGGYRLQGVVRFASGARALDAALVPVRAAQGLLLALVSLRGGHVIPQPGTWSALGMGDSDSPDVAVDAVIGTEDVVGGPSWYLDRPGFWIGGVGIAACWLGGAVGVLGDLARGLAAREPGPHQLAHLGACAAAIEGVTGALDRAARHVDERPYADHRPLALAVRHLAEQAAEEVRARAGRALGPALLVHDANASRRLADLEVYVRQHGAERDLERLGRDVLAGGGRLRW